MTTLAGFRGRVRALLQDESSPYRYSDSQILVETNGAVSRLLNIRPDAFVAYNFAPAAVAADGDTLPVPAALETYLVHVVAGELLRRDAEHASAERGRVLVDSALGYLVGGP